LCGKVSVIRRYEAPARQRSFIRYHQTLITMIRLAFLALIFATPTYAIALKTLWDPRDGRALW
jgi:hypothetical protein